MPRQPLVNLRVPPGEREAWVRAAGGESLSAWIRRQCNVAAGRAGLGLGERTVPVAEGPLRRTPEHQNERVRESEAWHRAVVAEAERLEAAGSPGRVAKPAESDPPAAVVVVKLDPMRAGRCRDHPNALPRFIDTSRCAWGCRLPDG